MYQQDLSPVSDSLALSAARALRVFGGTLDQLKWSSRGRDLFRRVLVWSVAPILVTCALVYLQPKGVLGWMRV
jgi:hypothetical protein